MRMCSHAPCARIASSPFSLGVVAGEPSDFVSPRIVGPMKKHCESTRSNNSNRARPRSPLFEDVRPSATARSKFVPQRKYIRPMQNYRANKANNHDELTHKPRLHRIFRPALVGGTPRWNT